MFGVHGLQILVLDIVTKFSIFSFDNDTIISYRNTIDNSINDNYDKKINNAELIPRGQGIQQQTAVYQHIHCSEREPPHNGQELFNSGRQGNYFFRVAGKLHEHANARWPLLYNRALSRLFRWLTTWLFPDHIQ